MKMLWGVFVLAYALLVVPLLAAVAFIIAGIKGFSSYRLVFLKGTASLLFVCLCPILQLLYKSPLPIEKFLLLFFGLILGALGDVLLAFKDVYLSKSNLFFILGLSSFLLGHIAYVAFFILLTKFNIICLIVIVNLAAVSFIVLKVGKCEFKKMLTPVAIYCLALSVLVGTGLSSLISGFSIATLIIFIAAILFYLSDAVLCFIYFRRNSPKYLVPINLSLYYSAQILLSFLPFLFTL